jgi:hypothetical protein
VPLCEICGKREAKHKCPLCGRLVCDEDWDESKGVCILCSSTLCQVCGKRLAIASCAACGRLVCDECSIQINPVVRLCIDCYRRYGRNWPPKDKAEHDVSRLAESVKSIVLYIERLKR